MSQPDGAFVFIPGQGDDFVCFDSAREIWELPGGAINRGENEEDAAKRETKEEVSVEGVILVRKIGIFRIVKDRGNTHQAHLFLGELPPEQKPRKPSDLKVLRVYYRKRSESNTNGRRGANQCLFARWGFWALEHPNAKVYLGDLTDKLPVD